MLSHPGHVTLPLSWPATRTNTNGSHSRSSRYHGYGYISTVQKRVSALPPRGIPVQLLKS